MTDYNLPSISSLPAPNLMDLKLPPLRLNTSVVENKYQCSQCPKSFKLKTTLIRHMKNHTGYKPYVCKACNKRFVRKDILAGHKESLGCIQRTLSLSNKRLFHNNKKTDTPLQVPIALFNITSILSCYTKFKPDSSVKFQIKSYINN
jgi:uncharacterized Zn-finger protein